MEIILRNKFLYGLLVILWLFIDLRWSVMTLFIPGPISQFVLVITTYVFVTIWFYMVWLRDYKINILIKVLIVVGIAYSSFVASGFTILIVNFHKINKTLPLYLQIVKVICNEFSVSLLAAVITAPLTISVFRKHYYYVALIVSMSILGMGLHNNFSTISKSLFTIGIYSAHGIAAIFGTYLVSCIFYRLNRNLSSEKVKN